MTGTMKAARAGACAAAALLAACSIVGPDEREQLGLIQVLPAWPAEVTVPAAAVRGEPFTVTVVTQVGGCVNGGPTRVRTRGLTADVRPYDVHNGGRVCPADIGWAEHTATLTFDQPGTATINFHGRVYPGEVATIARTITITEDRER
jgi:hypothetical protein